MEQRLKFKRFWSPCPPHITEREMDLAYNRADTRFHKLGKRLKLQEQERRRAARVAGQQAPGQPGPLTDHNLFADENRDNGNTMMEAMTEIVCQWQQYHPGHVPGGPYLAAFWLNEHLIRHCGLEVVMPKLIANEDYKTLERDLYSQQYPWVRRV
ncbi:Uu.00g113330.m01.CDS01 [Anthostomella pinea]|uniref:Uu.00g113330.m01.CDS01 n=1 Tax=Anthostomella pinea TaxID=933095 RepID=A0AAI8VGI2_9PEZI|nr:Uu.00g113330.m01.CDS01 [Anthostomella pinea]